MSKIVAFGEIMLRLAAVGGCSIAESKVFEACYGGTEANVLACLANFGEETQYLTALPDTELGNAVLNHLHSFNVGTDCVLKQGDVLGMYFVESGNGSRGSNVIYFRRYSEVAKLDQDAFDFDKVFEGASLFHISGISFALSQSCRRLSFRLVEEAKKRSVPVSFDFNYRSKLWSVEEARQCFLQVINLVDIVLAGPLDLSVFLDVSAEKYFEKYPNKLLVLRDRRVLDMHRHSVTVSCLSNKNVGYISPVITFDVKEKIGGGDAFDGAFLHKYLQGADYKNAIQFAISAFVLKHSVSGDTFTMKADEVEAHRRKLFGE